jgi:hypothetical protein
LKLNVDQADTQSYAHAHRDKLPLAQKGDGHPMHFISKLNIPRH